MGLSIILKHFLLFTVQYLQKTDGQCTNASCISILLHSIFTTLPYVSFEKVIFPMELSFAFQAVKAAIVKKI
jgi:hypothetical protein